MTAPLRTPPPTAAEVGEANRDRSQCVSAASPLAQNQFNRRDPFEIGPTGVDGIALIAVVSGIWGDWQPSLGHLEGAHFINLCRAALSLKHEGLGPTILIYKIDN